jgi:hypothetical protein
MQAFSALFWIAEHWWILAVIAVVALGATLWTGVVQLGVVVVALTKMLAEVIRFFSTQIAEKLLYGFVCVVLAMSVGWYHRGYVDDAKWAKAEAARAAAAERVRLAADAQAQKNVTTAQTAEDADAAAAKQRINAYALTLPKVLPDECRITAADLAAGGVPDVGKRAGAEGPGSRHVQQNPKAGRAR